MKKTFYLLLSIFYLGCSTINVINIENKTIKSKIIDLVNEDVYPSVRDFHYNSLQRKLNKWGINDYKGKEIIISYIDNDGRLKRTSRIIFENRKPIRLIERSKENLIEYDIQGRLSFYNDFSYKYPTADSMIIEGNENVSYYNKQNNCILMESIIKKDSFNMFSKICYDRDQNPISDDYYINENNLNISDNKIYKYSRNKLISASQIKVRNQDTITNLYHQITHSKEGYVTKKIFINQLQVFRQEYDFNYIFSKKENKYYIKRLAISNNEDSETLSRLFIFDINGNLLSIKKYLNDKEEIRFEYL